MADRFDLEHFLPYALNRAAETASRGFAEIYKAKYGMLRTEWRVLFHLGRYGQMTAREICDRADLHKTKVSRAVAALERRRFLRRRTVETDRRREILALTASGQAAYRHLEEEAQRYDRALSAQFAADDLHVLRACLERLRRANGPEAR